MISTVDRFSQRVENYIRYRPGYPEAVVDLLCQQSGLGKGSVVADLGSGTGILSKMLLQRGLVVQAVEPNTEMREAAERLLGTDPQFVSSGGTAEETGLPDHGVDLITAAQAFHWFDRAKAKKEFARILKPGGVVALIWNERRVTSTPFLREYETFLETHGTDYTQINHADITDADIEAFFAPLPVYKAAFPNEQVFDYTGLEGRLMSCSYAPAKGHPGHEPMIEALHQLFDGHAKGGQVIFEYDCRAWWAHYP